MAGFFDELRRRRVARTAAIYAVVAWAVIEAASVILPALQVPDWTVTFVVVMALLGFPVVLALSWVFDLTPRGVVRTPGKESLAPAERAALGRGRALDFVVIAILLGVIGWLGWERAFDPDTGLEGGFDSIAVLPFVNMSGDAENEYFSDGLAEELLNALVGVSGLHVAARTSSFQYKGRNHDVRDIGRELGVDTVLEGSVRKSGDRIRVTAQLIRAADGFHIWSETYDRDLEDVFAVQDEITMAIVDALELRIGSSARARVAARHTSNIDAYEAYLKGRFEMHRRTADSLERATTAFLRAVELDREYAAAHSGLSDTWILRSSYGGVDTQDALENAEPLAQRALELDPELAEAQASWGFVLAQKAEFAKAVEYYERAIELNPSYSPAFHWLGLAYQQLGRFNEAARVMRKAIEIDPRYATGKRALLSALRNIDANDEADALAARLAREHPDDPLVFYGLAGDAQQMGRPVDAIRHSVHALELDPANITVRIGLAYQLLQIGDAERGDEQVRIIERLRPGHPGLDHWPATRALFIGDMETYRAESERLLAKIPDGIPRESYLCNMNQILGQHAEALATCQAMLARLGWEIGDPIPPGFVNQAAGIIVSARHIGDDELVERITPAFEAELERMREAGTPDRGLRWAFILFRMFTETADDASRTAFFEAFESELTKGNWSPELLRRNPMFGPVAEDPRFSAMIERLETRLDRAREQASAVEIPGAP